MNVQMCVALSLLAGPFETILCNGPALWTICSVDDRALFDS